MKNICMETFEIRNCIVILTESDSLEVFPQTDMITSEEARELLESSGDGVREVYSPEEFDDWEKLSEMFGQVPAECININLVSCSQ